MWNKFQKIGAKTPKFAVKCWDGDNAWSINSAEA